MVKCADAACRVKILDKHALKAIFATVFGGLLTVMPIIHSIHSLGSEDDQRGDLVCNLTLAQSAAIRACAATALGSDASATCSYNITFGAALDGDEL